MIQQNIRDYNNTQYTVTEGSELVKELNDRTKYAVDGYNSIAELGAKVKQNEDDILLFSNGGDIEKYGRERLGVKQIFNKKNKIINRQVRTNTGQGIYTTSLDTSGYITLDQGETHFFLQMEDIVLFSLAFYDSAGNSIVPLDNAHPTQTNPANPYRRLGGNGRWEIPPNAVSVMFNIRYTNRDETDFIMMEYCSPTETLGSEFQEYYSGLPKDYLKRLRRLEYHDYNVKDANVVKVIDFWNATDGDDIAIQNALLFTSIYDYRTIIFDSKDWLITEAIVLSSNTTVIIDGCMIKQADLTFDNIFRGDNYTLSTLHPNGTPLDSTDIENIKILGYNNAILSGPDVVGQMLNEQSSVVEDMVGDRWGWRCLSIIFSRCTNIILSGFDLVKTMNWAITFEMCNTILIDKLFIDSIQVKNGDGLDFRAGCKNVTVTNCLMTCRDDCIAMTNLPNMSPIDHTVEQKPGFWRNGMIPNYIYAATQQETMQENIRISDCFLSSNTHGIIILAGNAGKTENITINNIIDVSDRFPRTYMEFINIYTGYGVTGTYTDNDISKIRINNIISNKSNIPTLRVSCKCDDVWLNNIKNAAGGQNLQYAPGANIGVTVTNS